MDKIPADCCETIVKLGFGLFHSSIFKTEANKAILQSMKKYLEQKADQVLAVVQNSSDLVKKNFEAWK